MNSTPAFSRALRIIRLTTYVTSQQAARAIYSTGGFSMHQSFYTTKTNLPSLLAAFLY
jgi:hypothetical protein